jgi:hypothetical protein
MKSVIPLLIASLAIAIAGAAQVHPAFLRGLSATAFHFTLFGPAVLWLVLVASGLVGYGKRGLWLLVGTPFALFGPVAWSMYMLACTFGGDAC